MTRKLLNATKIRAKGMRDDPFVDYLAILSIIVNWNLHLREIILVHFHVTLIFISSP